MEMLFIEVAGSNKFINNGLAYLAGAIGHRVGHEIIDMNYVDWSEEKLRQYIVSNNPKILGFSVKSSNASRIAALIGELKDQIGSLIIVGGPHISLMGRKYLEANPEIAFGFAFEAEQSLIKFFDYLAGNGSIGDIPGLIYRDNGEIRSNSYSFTADLDEINFPDYSHFTDIDPRDYFSSHPYPLLTSRGCPYNCIYCSVKVVSGSFWRYRSVENIIRELKEAKEKYGINNFELVDDNFTLSMDRAAEFCRMLIKSRLDLIWGCPNGIRADKVTEDLAALMRESGCCHVSLGIESGDERVFNGIKKGETLDDVARAAKILMSKGIKVTGFFIVGLPGDSIASTRKSVEFYRQLGLNGGIKWNFLVPYPQTELWDWVKSNGVFLEDFSAGRHFSKTGHKIVPVFETPDFPAASRCRAWRIANVSTGAYHYIFKPPRNKFVFQAKAALYLLVYAPEVLLKKITRRIRDFIRPF